MHSTAAARSTRRAQHHAAAHDDRAPRRRRRLTPCHSCSIDCYVRQDSRLSMTLHALLHMAETDGALTSEAIAAQTCSNAAVVRRTMAGLREAGLVRSEKGHGGGWTLARPLAQLTLGAIYDALGAPTLFAMGHRTETPDCLVEQAVNRAMGEAFDQAEALLVARLAEISL